MEALGLAGVLLSLAIPIANAAPVLLPMGGTLLLFWLTAALVRGPDRAQAALALAVFWGACSALLTGLRTSNVVFPGLLGLAGLALALARRDSLRQWRAAKRSGHFLWEAWTPYFIDFLTNEQLLAQRGGVVFEGRELTVVDLRRSLAEER